MKIKHPFSIIELLTVVLIIMLLISLIVPVFVNLKLNARSSLCTNNLRQIGVLLTSYQNDQSGYLPNDESFHRHSDGVACGYVNSCGKPHIPADIQFPKSGQNNQLYQNWNGHLLPYMDHNLPDQYTRVAMVTKICTRSSAAQLGGPENPPPPVVTKNGWVVIDDAYRIGGHQDLKTFICSEMHQNHIDVTTSLKFNGIKIPRVSQLITIGHTPWSAFADAAGWDYGMGGGLPTSYQANEKFFGKGIFINSYRMDQIGDISKKVLILEGKSATCGVYYSAGTNPYDGGDLSATATFNQASWDPNDPGLSFVHDSLEKFWVMKNLKYEWFKGTAHANELANRFNTQYAGRAYKITGANTSSGFTGSSIVSYIYPGDNGDYFNDFLKAFDPKIITTPFSAYIDEPNEYRYLTGKMNVLFGDGSAATKDQAWLFNNRIEIAHASQF